MRDKVAQWVRPEVRALSAYHVPDATDLIKLDAMENPYHWPDALIESWLGAVRDAQLNRYPDPAAARLKDDLRGAMGVPNGSDLLLGNGSDEIIQMVMMALGGAGRAVLSVEPGFVMYHMIARFLDMDYVGVPLRQDFTLDRTAMLAAIEEHQPAVVFLAYPNNPTGNLFDRSDMVEIIDAAPGVVIIDEAYHAFANDSWMSQLTEYDQLLVMRTVSKMGLAGLRLGLLAGAPAWLAEFDKVRLPYNINVLTQLTASFALRHRAVLDQQTDRIKQDRQILLTELQQFADLIVYPSQANFILFRVGAGRASQVFEGLKAAGVLLKNLDPAGGMLSDCLRVTVGTPDENATFLAALQHVLAGKTTD